MSDTSKALEALDRIFNYCEEIDLHIPEKEQTGYSMNDDVAIIREALFENQKTGHWIRLIEDYPFCDFEFKGCSVCRTHYPKLAVKQFKYCPNCGAKMEGE